MSDTDTLTQFLSTAQIGEMLGVHPLTVRGWIQSGELRGFSTNRPGVTPRWRIKRSDFEAFIEKRMPKPPAKTKAGRKTRRKAAKDYYPA